MKTIIRNHRGRSILKARTQVQEFFNQYTPSEALELLLSAFRAAESNAIWDLYNPTDLLQFNNALKKLLAVVFRLTENELRLIGSGVEHLERGGFYQPEIKYLTQDEAAAPAFTLLNYSSGNSLPNLKLKLDLIAEFALSKNCIVTSGNNLPVLTTAELLAKIIESVTLLSYQNPA